MCHVQSTSNCDDWGHNVFKDESSFQVYSNGNLGRTLRRSGQWGRGTCLDYRKPHRPTTWNYGLRCHLFDSRSYLVVISGTVIAHLYDNDILQSIMLLIILRHLELFYKHSNDQSYTARVAMNCLYAYPIILLTRMVV